MTKLIEGEDAIFDQLEAMPVDQLKRQMELGCRRIFLRMFNQDIAEQVFDRTRSVPDESNEERWGRVLRNSLVTVWHDSQDLRIDDKDILFEQVLGISEAIERSGFGADEAISLISEFLTRSGH